MKVHWTQTAQDHLDAIRAYIAHDSSEYALRTLDRLTRRFEQTAAFPLSGRRVPEYEMEQIREAIEGPYGIACRITLDQIGVLAVVHTAEDSLRSEERDSPQSRCT
ncbi:MAG TPA: type II toxin-antitoxin system RelE/ParE family toxin [Candidatus Hydrogenedentes bacterium]|nr:type II toxin-antitoxin system RelE/ParE family toxin [Candidatus Hydrogenedentota bacterium]